MQQNHTNAPRKIALNNFNQTGKFLLRSIATGDRLNATLVKVKEGTFSSTAGEGDWSDASSPALFANWCLEVRLLTPIDWEIGVLSFLMIAVESGGFRYSRKASLVVKLARG